MTHQVGNRIVVIPVHNESAKREATIIDLRGTAGDPLYVVEWADNGHRTIVRDGHGATITAAP